jgi:hypothetical protein
VSSLGGCASRWRRFAAFPSGTLNAVLLIPPPCAAVRAGEFGVVAARLITLLGPQDLHGYAFWLRVYTGAQVFVRDTAGAQLTSSPAPDGGPPVLPASGTVSYQDATWLVWSFQIAPATIVYMLISPS